MPIINMFVFYIFFCSSVLVYGICALHLVEIAPENQSLAPGVFKSLVSVTSTVTLAFLIKAHLLKPLGISDLYPLVALLLFAAFSVFFEVILEATAKRSSVEFAMPYLVSLLALNEASSLVEAIIISSASLGAYYMLIPVLKAFNHKIAFHQKTDAYRQKISLLFCMAILMLALYGLNISWFNLKMEM